jgi:hypothetical protein
MNTISSVEVERLYEDLVRTSRMRPILLGNIGTLRLLEKSNNFSAFMRILVQEWKKVKGTNAGNLPLVCILIVCYDGYDFNEVSIKEYNNAFINGLWKAIFRSVPLSGIYLQDLREQMGRYVR